MTNETKLLMALCEALGFEVEVDLDYMPRKESRDVVLQWIGGYNVDHFKDRRLTVSGPDGSYVIDEDGLYTSLLIDPIVSYRLHKISKK